MRTLNYFRILLLLIFISAGTSKAYSQCKVQNKFFQAGELLEYDLYIKLGVTTKGGQAIMKTQATTYEGKEALKMTLTSNSHGFVRKMFQLDDTLSCYVTPDLVPLAYFKDAHEGGDYTKERVGYSYPGDGSVVTRSIRHKNNNFKFDETIRFNNCAYDLMSVVYYARTINYTNMVKGNKVSVDFISGRNKMSMQIIHNGIEKLKANNGEKYECIKLTLKISDNAFKDEKDAMTVYITNDANRLPVRIDSNLKIGSTKAVLKRYKGNKYPVVPVG